MNRLIKELIENGYLKSDEIIAAFSEINRVEFVPDDLERHADVNIPLPIGHGQTISQPLTVAIMLELLDPQAGNNVLDVGSGSGWTAALLSKIVGDVGHVTGVEIIPELCERAKKNIEKYGFISKGIAEVQCGDGSEGFEKNAPYDRILVSAMADELPPALLKQLKVGGKMVIPVHNTIWFVEKTTEDDFQKEVFEGFAFVPLVHYSR